MVEYFVEEITRQEWPILPLERVIVHSIAKKDDKVEMEVEEYVFKLEAYMDETIPKKVKGLNQ